jgi:integrase
MSRSYINNYYIPYFWELDVRDIDEEKLQSFKVWLKKRKHLKVRTRKNVLAILRVMFKWLKVSKAVKVIPIFPTVRGNDSRVKRALDVHEQEEILERIPAKYHDVFPFAMETSVRPGELCAIQVKDLELRKGLLNVQRTYSGHVLKENTKEDSKLPVPLSDRAQAIAEWHVRDKLPEAFLFINPDTGRGFKTNWMSKVWRKYSEVTFYEGSRHSLCTQIAHMGATEFEAQALMRHADPRSAQAYIHTNVSKFKGLVDRRGEVVQLPHPKVDRQS